MAAEDGHLQAVAGHPDNRSRAQSEDLCRNQLAAALQEGTLVILGEQLPEWTPEHEEPPPAEIVIAADTLRQVLLDQDLATRADPRGLTITGAVIVGELNLNDTGIGYPLNFLYCRFTDPLALEQTNLHALNLNGSHLTDAIRLSGAHIGGRLSMRGASVSGADADGNSLVADNLQADRDVFLDEGFTAAGAIRLSGAHIGGQLNLRGATLTGVDADGDSLVADNLQADGHVFLGQGFTAAGAIWLLGAHIGGQLNLRGATLTGANARGNGLDADNLQADRDVFLDEGFTAAGAIWLSGAHIGGEFSLRGATLTGVDADGDSLVADNLQADRDVFLDQGFTAAGAIALRGTDIGNLVVGSDRESLPQLGDVTGWRIRDMHGVIRTDRGAAAHWLTTQQAAQPWQELAAVYERNGQPADARWVRYQSAVRSTGNTTGLSRLSRQIYRWTTGHGYYPLAALFWLVVIFALAWGLTATWADDFTTTTTATIRADLTTRAEAAATGARVEDPLIPDPPLPGRVPAAWCTDGWDVSCLNPPVYALTTAFPAATTTQPWAPPDNSWAPTVVFHLLRLSAWVFTALLLAGVTGLLRKQT